MKVMITVISGLLCSCAGTIAGDSIQEHRSSNKKGIFSLDAEKGTIYLTLLASGSNSRDCSIEENDRMRSTN
jgi:hypothetical protein